MINLCVEREPFLEYTISWLEMTFVVEYYWRPKFKGYKVLNARFTEECIVQRLGIILSTWS